MMSRRELSFAALPAKALPQMGTDLPLSPSFPILGCPVLLGGRWPSAPSLGNGP